MRLSPRHLLTLLALALLSGAPATARAQVGVGITGSIGAGVEILFAPLSAAGVRPLAFGTLLPGTTTTVLPRTASGSEFRITGTRGRKSMDISFTLPANLRAPSGATIPLNFNGNFASLCELDASGACVLASLTTWNPVTTPTFFDKPTRFRPGAPRYVNDQFAVYLGGAATIPPAGLPAGTYTATLGVLLVLN